MYGQVKKWPDEIRLKDGTLIIGEIVEHKPDKVIGFYYRQEKLSFIKMKI
ncbi:MAG: hypothetical protein Q4A56_07250 [Porphyromonadaceae bacterium]|nr:hypothetical protein [Porphyromonadaceae bacterium]